MALALIPGSFDPITLGHIDLVKRALTLYGEVVLAVMHNPEKVYRHTADERRKMAELAVSDIPHVRVVASEGLTIDLFDEVGADVIVKGVRNEIDRAYEKILADWNLAHNPRAKTVFLEASDDYKNVSSTEVKKILAEGGDPEGLISPAVLDYLRAQGDAKSK